MRDGEIVFAVGTASDAEIRRHLSACSDNFIPPLHERVELEGYARDLADKSVTFEAWDADTMVGLVAVYFNDLAARRGFVSSVSVISTHLGRGIAIRLMRNCIEYGNSRGFRSIGLEVHSASEAAIGLYRRCGFVATKANANFLLMDLSLEPD